MRIVAEEGKKYKERRKTEKEVSYTLKTHTNSLRHFFTLISTFARVPSPAREGRCGSPIYVTFALSNFSIAFFFNTVKEEKKKHTQETMYGSCVGIKR